MPTIDDRSGANRGEVVALVTFRFLLLPPDAWNTAIRCPDCDIRMFDAGSGLSGVVEIVCRKCRRKWYVVFHSTQEEYFDAVKGGNKVFSRQAS